MNNTLGKQIGIGATVLALALAGAGCSQQSTTQQSAAAASAASSQAAALKSTDWLRKDVKDLKQGGTLTLSISQLPDNWNYNQADGALDDLNKVRLPLGAWDFVRADEAGKPSLNPDYIVSANVKSQDPEVIEVKYNPKAVWEDGTPITIKDMDAFVKAMSGADKSFQVSSSKGYEDIESVKQTTDQFTGEITFKKGHAQVDWQTFIYPDLPASISSDANKFNTAYVKQATPSVGPYKVTNVDQAGGVITEEKNPKWWGAQPLLDKIVFKVETQTNEPQAFANKEIDALPNIASADSYKTAKSRTDAKVEKTNGVTWTHVTMNATRGALQDVNVRKAIAMAINREVIGQVVVGPLEAPVSLVNNPVFMPGQAGYKDAYNGALKYDPKAAEKILTDAGYTKGSDGIYAKGDQKLQFAVTVPAETKSNANRAAQIQKDLTAIGMKVDIQTVPSDQYFKAYVNKKNFDMVTFSWVGTLFPIQSAANTFYPADSAQNYTGIGNPKVGELNAKANSDFDPAKRTDEANEMAAAMVSDYTIVPFYAMPIVMGVRSDLANYGASQFETVNWTTVGFVK